MTHNGKVPEGSAPSCIPIGRGALSSSDRTPRLPSFWNPVLKGQGGVSVERRLAVICLVAFFGMSGGALVGPALPAMMGTLDATEPWQVVASLLLFGSGFGLVSPQLNALVTEQVSRELRRGLVSLFKTMKYVGQTAAPWSSVLSCTTQRYRRSSSRRAVSAFLRPRLRTGDWGAVGRASHDKLPLNLNELEDAGRVRLPLWRGTL